MINPFVLETIYILISVTWLAVRQCLSNRINGTTVCIRIGTKDAVESAWKCTRAAAFLNSTTQHRQLSRLNQNTQSNKDDNPRSQPAAFVLGLAVATAFIITTTVEIA